MVKNVEDKVFPHSKAGAESHAQASGIGQQATGNRQQAQGTRAQGSGLRAHYVTSRCALSTRALLQIVLFSGIFVLNFFQGTDVDLWWHLATGRYIVETGGIPTTDPFSYTAAGQPWVAHEWLAEIGMYLLYRFGGYLALVLCFALLVTLTYWLAFRTLGALGLGIPVSACITFWIAFMSMAGWHVRPQAFSYLFFSLYLYLLVRARNRYDRWLWLLPLVMVVWVNLHAGYVMGLLILGMFLTGEGINRFRKKLVDRHQVSGIRQQVEGLSTQRSTFSIHHHKPAFRRLVVVAATTVLATIANPQGISILLYPFTYAGTQNASMKYITEWQSPNFHDYFFFVFGASMMVLMIAPGRRPVDWALGIPLLALTAMSLQSVRVIPFYAIVAAPFLGLRLTPLRLRRLGDGDAAAPSPTASERELGLSQGGRKCPRRATPWNWLLLAFCLTTMFSTLFLTDRAQIAREPRMNDFPTQGAQYIRDTGLKGNLLNTFHWGGYLIWFFYPERRVFVDGRPDMYGDPFMEEYRKIHDARPGWDQLLDRHDVEIALVERDGRVATLLAASKEWKEVFRGEIELVFVRIAPRL